MHVSHLGLLRSQRNFLLRHSSHAEPGNCLNCWGMVFDISLFFNMLQYALSSWKHLISIQLIRYNIETAGDKGSR